MFLPHCIANTEGSQIIEDLAVTKEDKIIRKRRYSLFFGINLDLYLRRKEIASFDEEAHNFALKELKNILGCRIIR